jgi:hypothetical protein
MIRQTVVGLIASVFVPLQIKPAASAEKSAFFLAGNPKRRGPLCLTSFN